MAPNSILHLCEGQVRNCDRTGAQHFETRLLVEWDQVVLTHKHGESHVRQAAQVLLIAPHQDRSFALLTEGAMDGQDMNMDRVAMRLVKSQCALLPKDKKASKARQNKLPQPTFFVIVDC